MTRRPGITVIEALVAMFVAALGMISLLVLFPLGAVQMGQALKDERTAQTAAKADGYLRWYWQTEVVERNQAGTRVGDPFLPWPNIFTPQGADPFVRAFTNPHDPVVLFYQLRPPVANTVVPRDPVALLPIVARLANPANPLVLVPPTFTTSWTLPSGLVVPDNNPASMPVFIDPIGWQARSTQPAVDQCWVCGAQALGVPGPIDAVVPRIPRRTLRPTYYQAPAGALPLPAPIALTNTPGASPLYPTPLRLNLNWNCQQSAIPNLDVRYPAQNPPPNAGPPVPPIQPPVPLYNARAADPARTILTSMLLDDLTFDEAGVAVGPTGQIERLGWYSWAAVLQQPDVSRPESVNLTVLVFDRRPVGIVSPEAERMYPLHDGLRGLNAPPVVVMQPGQSVFRIYHAPDNVPPIAKGRWVMDGTVAGAPNEPTNPPTPFPQTPPPPAPPPLPSDSQFPVGAPRGQVIRNAVFYRVVSVTPGLDATGVNYVDVELQNPIQPPLGTTPGQLQQLQSPVDGGRRPGYRGQIYVFQNLSEVFVRPTINAPTRATGS